MDPVDTDMIVQALASQGKLAEQQETALTELHHAITLLAIQVEESFTRVRGWAPEGPRAVTVKVCGPNPTYHIHCVMVESLDRSIYEIHGPTNQDNQPTTVLAVMTDKKTKQLGRVGCILMRDRRQT